MKAQPRFTYMTHYNCQVSTNVCKDLPLIQGDLPQSRLQLEGFPFSHVAVSEWAWMSCV